MSGLLIACLLTYCQQENREETCDRCVAIIFGHVIFLIFNEGRKLQVYSESKAVEIDFR